MLKPTLLKPDHITYPEALQSYGPANSTQPISLIGNPNLLQRPSLALFCSIKCPGDLILKTYDLARSLRDAATPTISGFHSPMEKECLLLLLRGTQPVIYCPARSLEKMRLLKEHKLAVEGDRLLILSPFQNNQHRMTSALAQKRNQFVATIAHTVFIAYASPNSKTEAFAKQIVARNKPLLTFESPDNQNLIELGAQTIDPVFEGNARWRGHSSGVSPVPPLAST